MFEFTSEFEHSRDDLFEYHARPGAIDRLIPPWQPVRILKRNKSIDIGSEVLLENRVGFAKMTWLARHTALEVPRHFQDTQISGPFGKWIHDHLFEMIDENRTKLIDRIDYTLKFFPAQNATSVATNQSVWIPIDAMLQGMFRYRHRITRQDLELGRMLEAFDAPVRKIAVSGASGMIGKRFSALASVLGFEVVRILRPDSRVPSDAEVPALSVRLDPEKGFESVDTMLGVDAVVNLSGFGIAEKRWSNSIKKLIWDSRVEHTKSLVRHLSSLPSPPPVLASASAIGYYGDSGASICNESGHAGSGFLGELAKAWEEEANKYARGGRRVAIGRLGMVLHPFQGALSKMLPIFRWGLGGRIGSGKQYWSWIHIDDAASAMLFLACNPNCEGPFNIVAPQSPTNLEFTQTLSTTLSRPAFVPAPAFALKIAIGEMADQLLLTSTRAVPQKLTEAGFPFRTSEIQQAIPQLLGYA